MENKEKDAVREKEDFISKPALPKKSVEIKSIVMIVVVILLLLLILESVLLYGFKKDENSIVKAVASVLPFPMAMVEYRPVMLKDYWKELDLILRTCEGVGTDCQITDNDRSQVYTNLINEQVIYELGKDYGVTVADEDLNNEMDSIIEQNGGKEEFEKLLVEKFGWNMDSFKQRVNLSLLAKNLEDKLIEKVDAKHILIAIAEGASEEEVNKAKDKAQEVLDKINGGGDFDALAKEYSDDTSTKDNGGDLGFFARGVMVSDFENIAFSLSKGQVSNLVRTDFGWHIIKVVDKRGEIDQDFLQWLDSQKASMRIWEFYKVPEVQ